MSLLCLLGLIVISVLCSASEYDVSVSEKLRVLENILMEQRRMLAEQQKMLVEQGHRLSVQEKHLKEQERQIIALKQMNADQKHLNDQQQRTNELHQHFISKLDMIINKKDEKISRVLKYIQLRDSRSCDNCDAKTNTSKQVLQSSDDNLSFEVRQLPERVAFTSFLDHDVGNLGIGQTIVYNGVLLNEVRRTNSLQVFLPAQSVVCTYSTSPLHPNSWIRSLRD